MIQKAAPARGLPCSFSWMATARMARIVLSATGYRPITPVVAKTSAASAASETCSTIARRNLMAYSTRCSSRSDAV